MNRGTSTGATYEDTTLRHIRQGRSGFPTLLSLHGVKAFDKPVQDAIAILKTVPRTERPAFLQSLEPVLNESEQEALLEELECLEAREELDSVTFTRPTVLRTVVDGQERIRYVAA